VTTGGEAEEVEGADVGGLDTGKVAESLDDTLVLVVDDQGTATLAVLAVAGLTLTGADLLRGDDLGNVGVSLEALESGDGLLGLLDRLDGGGNDEGDLGDTLDAVTAGEDEGGEGSGGNSRDDSEALLVLVDLDVPLAPDLGGREHATATAHVTEGSLSGTVRSSTTDTGDTGDGATSSPGLGGGLLTSVLRDGDGLAAVLGDRLVDLRDNVRPDGGGEDGRCSMGGNMNKLLKERDERERNVRRGRVLVDSPSRERT
jgi:hypothetical protein